MTIPEPQPTIITGDELAAFRENLAALAACPTCGGDAALLVEPGTVLPVLLHNSNCPELADVALDHELRLILGEGKGN